jgi:hypothetical protein
MTIVIQDDAHQSKHVGKQTSEIHVSKGKAIHGGVYNTHVNCKQQHKPAFISKAKWTIATQKELRNKE